MFSSAFKESNVSDVDTGELLLIVFPHEAKEDNNKNSINIEISLKHELFITQLTPHFFSVPSVNTIHVTS